MDRDPTIGYKERLIWIQSSTWNIIKKENCYASGTTRYTSDHENNLQQHKIFVIVWTFN